MREILFRGKRIDNGEWVYGVPTKDDFDAAYIVQGLFECDEYRCTGADGFDVDENTVGQYTGLTDKNGKKIFEGDIVNVNTKPDSLEHGYKCKHLVIRFDEYHRFVASGRLEYPLCNHYEWEVIGNIHDNPELLGGEDNENTKVY